MLDGGMTVSCQFGAGFVWDTPHPRFLDLIRDVAGEDRQHDPGVLGAQGARS